MRRWIPLGLHDDPVVAADHGCCRARGVKIEDVGPCLHPLPIHAEQAGRVASQDSRFLLVGETSKFWTSDDRAPRGPRERHAKKEWSAKARTHPRVASALPHSEGIAYKPLCGEIAMCSRVGRMGSIK